MDFFRRMQKSGSGGEFRAETVERRGRLIHAWALAGIE